MENYTTAEELEIELGEQLRSARLRRNLTQNDLAKSAGISRTAIRALEQGNGSTLLSLIRVLKALEMQSWIKTLHPAVSISPLQILKLSRPRQRARPSRKSVTD